MKNVERKVKKKRKIVKKKKKKTMILLNSLWVKMIIKQQERVHLQNVKKNVKKMIKVFYVQKILRKMTKLTKKSRITEQLGQDIMNMSRIIGYGLPIVILDMKIGELENLTIIVVPKIALCQTINGQMFLVQLNRIVFVKVIQKVLNSSKKTNKKSKNQDLITQIVNLIKILMKKSNFQQLINIII